jgi:hypothetical protein
MGRGAWPRVRRRTPRLAGPTAYLMGWPRRAGRAKPPNPCATSATDMLAPAPTPGCSRAPSLIHDAAGTGRPISSEPLLFQTGWIKWRDESSWPRRLYQSKPTISPSPLPPDYERNGTFKLIPHCAKGSWIISQTVGPCSAPPVPVMCRRCFCSASLLYAHAVAGSGRLRRGSSPPIPLPGYPELPLAAPFTPIPGGHHPRYSGTEAADHHLRHHGQACGGAELIHPAARFGCRAASSARAAARAAARA